MSSRGLDQPDFILLEILPYEARIPGQQTIGVVPRMGADQEIRNNSSAFSSSMQVLTEYLTRIQGCL